MGFLKSIEDNKDGALLCSVTLIITLVISCIAFDCHDNRSSRLAEIEMRLKAGYSIPDTLSVERALP